MISTHADKCSVSPYSPILDFRPAPQIGDQNGIGQGPRKYVNEAAAMRSRPGEWFKLLVAATDNAAWSHQQAISTGRRAAFRPSGAYEATVRGNEVFVRYIGEADGV